MQIPRIILVLVAIPRLFEVLKRPAYSVPANGMYWSKILISVILAALASIELVDHLFLNSSAPLYRHDVLVSATGIAAFAFAAVMHHIEHFRSSVGSTALLFFWLFSIVAEAIRLRTLFLDDAPHIELAINAAAIVLTIAVFVLENLPKPRPYYSSLPTSDTDTSCDEQKCPELYANIFSRLTFHWMDPLMKLGASKDLEMDDLWNLKPSDTALVNSGTFSKQWNEQLLKKKPSLLAVCLKVYGPMFLSTAVFKACQDLCSFIQPTFLRQMMEFADSWSRENRGHEQPISRGFAIALCMLATAITQTLFLHQYFHICIVTGMRLKTAVITAVYKKALKLSSSSRQSSTVGEIVNLMAVDASRLGDLTTYLHILWSGPFQISLALYFLYQALGPSVFAGVAVMLVMIPINAVLATKSRDLNKVQMKNKDGRTKLMDEILNGIKVIKLYAWEIPFAGKVNEVRERELATLKNIGYLSATQSFTWACTPFLVSFLTFATYSLVSNEPLTSTKVFVSLALFNLLQFPLTVFPNVITSVIDASVSFNRLYTFLMNEELDPSSVVHEYRAHAAATTDGSSVERISIKSGTFRWSKNSTEPVLKDISISVHDGSLVTLVGQVGSGKTSILSAILGEMYKSSGEVVVRGSIAYVSQTAWIMNSTLRENITFGKRFDPVFYEATISACGLKPDLEMLPAGDMTEIGEKGINLSGGQKQRISLARAVYSRADIYLLDDTLSAVDAHVGRHIFEKVIGPRGLLRDKAKLFVTHSIHFLPEVDVVHLLQNGSIVESGGYEEVMGRGKLIFNLMKEYGKRKEDTEEAFEDAPSRAPSQGQTPAKSMSRAGSKDMLPTKDAAAVPAAPRGNLMTKEESAKGSVSWSVYSSYAESCSFRNVIAYLAVAVMSQMLSISQNLYLADWADANDKRQNKFLRGLLSGEDHEESVLTRLGIYGSIGLLYSVTVIFQVIFAWIYCGIRSARLLHNQMLQNVLHLPQSYFGFSKDMYTVDEVLPRTFQTYFRTLFNVLSVLVVNAIGNWVYILFVIPLSFLYMYFQRYYLCTSRELKRLESVSKSPVYAHFQESLGGVSTIRAYNQESRFITTNEDRVDFNSRAYYPSVSSNRWLAVRLEFIGALILFGSALFAVITIAVQGYISASLVGLALTYSLNVTQSLNWMVRQSCEIETNIVAVERIKEYVELPQEAPYQIPNAVSSPGWPEHGVIEFKNYSTRYREGLDLVLNNISFAVKPNEKIGIVGRTGAGKSSLTLALFRIIEAVDGEIVIDSKDISKMGLYDLRSRMTIIPQDAFLFTGTVRDNIDPFRTASDSDLWAALEASNLKDVIARLEGKLDAPVFQNGENFSTGQRQLICLARAVMRKSKILVLDEATAAIDYETDAQIQKTIRELAQHSTVVTIAHRINTIIDYDRILVLDAGRVAELDTPEKLLSNRHSKFFALAKEAGLVK